MSLRIVALRSMKPDRYSIRRWRLAACVLIFNAFAMLLASFGPLTSILRTSSLRMLAKASKSLISRCK